MAMDAPKAVSLFSGLGGLDIGLHQAGFETVVCVEKNPDAARTLKANSRKHSYTPDHGLSRAVYPWRVIDQDIQDVAAKDILKEGDVTRDEVALVAGGPPCQTFSRSNEGSRDGTNSERGRLFEHYARILHELEPDAFIFENVRGLASANDGEDLKTVKERLAGDLYTVQHKVLNAADFGVPQTRKRIFIIGMKDNTNPAFPGPTHSEGGEDGEEWVDAGQALAEFDLDAAVEEQGGYRDAIISKYGPLLRRIPEGANYQHFSERRYDTEEEKYVEREEDELDEREFGWRTRHWNYLLKLDRDRPSWTLQANPGSTIGPFHWRSRPLTFLEQMRLQTIPRSYAVDGDPDAVQRQIGNAVPPMLGKALGEQILHQLGHGPRGTDTVGADHGLPDREVSPASPQDVEVVEVMEMNSPWMYADEVLSAVEQGGSVELKADKGRIPLALDALELARRAVSGGRLQVTLRDAGYDDDEETDSILHAEGKLQRAVKTRPR